MDRVANILDPIHPTLASEVWDHPHAERPKLKQPHREWILHTVTSVLERHGYHQSHEWLSLVLTGSLTTYQYSDSSDCDVSLFVDSEHFPEWSRAEMIGIMVGNVDGITLPGTMFAMQCFVVPKGLTKEDLYKPGLRSGYDIQSQEWVVPPDPARSLDIEQQRNEAYVYAMECADKMERLLRYDPERAEDYWHQIHAARRRAQQEGRGDFSLPNIVYKFLANRGLFPQIADLTGEYIAHTSAYFNDDQPPKPEDIEEFGPDWDLDRQERNRVRALPNVMYHVAPVERRDAIRQQGLDPSAERINQDSNHSPGVYLWEDPEVAMKYRGQGPNMYRDMDLHAVTVDRSKLKEDPWFNLNHEDRAQDFPGAWYSEEPIPAENIHRFYPSVWRPWDKTSALDSQAVLDANRGTDLAGLPGPVNVPGHGKLQFGGHADIQRIANEYNAQHGLGPHPTDYTKVNPQHAAAVAQEYDRMPHNPQDPEVAAAYDALAKETRAQYDHAVKNGYQFEFYPEHDPYPNSPREAVLDLHHNKHMYVYPSVEGFGSGDDHSDHPLMGDSGVRWGGKPVTHNDLFRAIHDFYGHAKEGLGFRADGEDNAYRQHAAMFTPQAQRALASETRGQNSWVNYGPHGEHNQTATSDTIYAPQKAGLLPGWASHPELHRTARVADAGKARGIYQDFRPNVMHPPGPNGPEHPFLYDPALDMVFLGPPNALHWELVRKVKELRPQYNAEDAFTAPTFMKNPNHVPGRMEAATKKLHFLGGPYPREVRERINNALGGPPLPPEEEHEEDPFGFDFPTA